MKNGFQKLDKIKDPNRQSKQLEELTGKMRECKRLIKEFDREIKDAESANPPEVNKQLNEKKQSLFRANKYTLPLQIKELNSYVALRKTSVSFTISFEFYSHILTGYAQAIVYTSSLGNKRVELFDMGAGGSDPTGDDNVRVASEMNNQELIDAGRNTMDETDQAIERSKKAVEQTIEVGAQTAVALKGQTEQMGRIVNELDTIQFSIKKASQLVKEIGRQVATDKCIMLFLLLIVLGVIAIIIVKVLSHSPPQFTSFIVITLLVHHGSVAPNFH
ncbi:putative plant SNARE 13 [Asimina triloba]